MKLEDLIEFIKKEDKRIKERCGNYEDNEKRILARTVKITEELGELCDEVLGFADMQRPEKAGKYDDSNLSEEFADVLITTLLLAETMEVDIEKALKQKMEKIDKRYEN